MRLIFALAAVAFAVGETTPTMAEAATCDPKDFASAVDQSGANLRAMTARAQPKLQEKLRRYKEAKKLDAADYENVALDDIQDPRLDELDQQSSSLLMKVDTLGRVPPGSAPDCAKLDEVKAASAELDAVIKAKSDYMLKRLDEKIAAAEAASPSSREGTKPAAQKSSPPVKAPTSVATIKPPAPVPAARPRAAESEAKVATAPPVVQDDLAAAPKPNDAYTPPVAGGTSPAPEDGFTIEEIRDATRGFFGTLSTNLATVIEHAFKQSGRPTAYVLGTEGGGALIAGFRYGEGTLYMRSMSGTRKVYWHGPSLGTDFGASGSRTMFLIYRMHEPEALYRGFTGVDGSAFFVGGVGLTLLKGGQVIMAPIRTGVGMRIGANIGYVRFTDTATWNPF